VDDWPDPFDHDGDGCAGQDRKEQAYGDDHVSRRPGRLPRWDRWRRDQCPQDRVIEGQHLTSSS
jgi:hypothetical protein